MPKINIREQDPRKYEAVKAEQDKLKAICRLANQSRKNMSLLRAYCFLYLQGNSRIYAGEMY